VLGSDIARIMGRGGLSKILAILNNFLFMPSTSPWLSQWLLGSGS